MDTNPPMNTSMPEAVARERAALLTLLADDDARVVQMIEARILAQGPEAAAWLEPHRLSDDPTLRRRVRGILLSFARRQADHDFLAYCLRHRDGFDLETAALLLARTAQPELNVEAYRAVLDDFAGQLTERLSPAVGAREMLQQVNDWLFGELGFRGNRKEYYAPENNYLNEIIDRRLGNPIGLSVVYLLLARRLRLPVAGIGFPGHFLCRYQDAADSIYIDVFDGGRLLTKADCVQQLLHSAFGLQEEFMAPVTPRRILLRLCGNLHQSYLHLEDHDAAQRMQGYKLALQRPE
jgi:regulator of sirC expression with transglutaminase-like and TPR domain